MVVSIVHLKIAIFVNCFDLQTFFTPFWKPYKQANYIDYFRSHQSLQEMYEKAKKQNVRFLSLHPLIVVNTKQTLHFFKH